MAPLDVSGWAKTDRPSRSWFHCICDDIVLVYFAVRTKRSHRVHFSVAVLDGKYSIVIKLIPR